MTCDSNVSQSIKQTGLTFHYTFLPVAKRCISFKNYYNYFQKIINVFVTKKITLTRFSAHSFIDVPNFECSVCSSKCLPIPLKGCGGYPSFRFTCLDDGVSIFLKEYNIFYLFFDVTNVWWKFIFNIFLLLLSVASERHRQRSASHCPPGREAVRITSLFIIFPLLLSVASEPHTSCFMWRLKTNNVQWSSCVAGAR